VLPRRGFDLLLRDLQLCGIWTIHAGRIVRAEWLEAREEALEAAGQRE
jgi:hypothetical protein